MPNEREGVTLEALLELHDEMFVSKAYEVILGRMPDPGGLANYLAQVRAGAHKAQIIAELAESPEGVLKSVDLPGLPFLVSRYRKRAPSLWHRVLRQLMSGATEPSERQLRAIDNQLYLLDRALSAQAKQIADLTSLLKGKLLVSSGVITDSRDSENERIHAPPLSHLSPSLGRIFTELKAAIALKRVG
jgi:hypothetical protein